MLKISRPATPAVEAVGRMHITGNVTPHVWYFRSEFRTAAGRPNRNMITIAADVLYWHRPEEVRDEENGGIFVGYARKFQRDLLQYNYTRRAAVFGMSEREAAEACLAMQKAGLIKIHYRTERIKGKLCHNIVYIELLPEAFAATLTGPNVGPVVKTKGAKRGRHAAKGEQGNAAPTLPELEEVPDETAGVDDEGEDETSGQGGKATSQNFGRVTSQNLERVATKFWDTYNENSLEISSLRDFFRGGVFQATGDAPPAQLAEHAAPVADTTPTPHSSSGNAALEKPEPAAVASPVEHSSSDVAARQKAEGTPFGTALHDLIAAAASIPTAVLEQLPPDGGAAGAAEDPEAPSLEEFEAMLAGDETQASNPENVPGAAAAGRAGGEDAPSGDGGQPKTASVNDLAPIPHAELSSRPLAAPESEVYRALRTLVGNTLPSVLAETTRTGALLRQDHWPRLTVPEIRHVTLVAQAEARATQGSMVTLGIRGLDRLIGAVKPSKASDTQKPGQGPPSPVQLSHLDPHLQVGQRCTVGGRLGVVFDVRANGYLVDLDTGDRITVDRAVAAQLGALKGSSAPMPTATPTAPAVTEAPKGKAVAFLKMAQAAGVAVPLPGGD